MRKGNGTAVPLIKHTSLAHTIRCVTIVCLFGLGKASALDLGGVAFYAPFDGSAEAVMAAGDPKPQGQLSPQLEFIPGVVGQAVVTGRNAKENLSYAVAKHLNEKAGALSIWIKPMNWQSGDAQQHLVLYIPGRLLLYHYWESNAMCFYWMNGSTVLWGPGYMGLNLDRDHWHHIVLSWGDRKCVAYYNGRQQGQAVDMPKDVPAWQDGGILTLSPPDWTADGRNVTAIDELMTFNRPLSEQEARALYRGVTVRLPRPHLRIGRTPAAPRVDGIVSPEEWSGAAKVTDFVDGLFGLLSRRRASAQACYDDRFFYLAVTLPGSTATTSSEEISVWLSKPDPSAGMNRFSFTEKGGLQHEGVGGATSEAATGGSVARCQWRTDSKKGVAGVEAAIPWSLLGAAQPKSGDTWRFNLVRRFSQRYGDLAAWADVSKAVPRDREAGMMSDPTAWGEITLGGDAPLFAMEDLGQLHYARLGVKSRVIRTSQRSEKVNSEVRLQPSDLKEIVDPQTFVRTWSGTQLKYDRVLALKQPVNDLRIKSGFDDVDINSVWIKVADSSGGVLYEAQRPFVAHPPVITSVHLYPSANRVEVHADVSNYREAAPGELCATVQLLNAAGKLLEQARLAKFDSARQVIALPLVPLPLGRIVVRTTLKRGTQVVSTFDTSFDKIALGPWSHSKLGRDEIVIAPFTPVEVKGQRELAELEVSVWGRTYRWQDSLFPVQISSAGEDLLAGPIELLEVASPSGQMKLTGRPNPARVKVTATSSTRAVVECEGMIGATRVRARHLLEYDGMCLTQLEVLPSSQIGGLSLCIPLKPEQSTLYHRFCYGGTVRGSENRGRGVGLKGMADLGFPNTFWLGNEDRGLTWFAEDAAGWRLGKALSPMSVFADEQHTLLIARFAAGPVTRDTPMKLTFGVIATPVKKLRDNWRFLRVKRDWSYDWFMSFTPSNNYITHVKPTWKEYLDKQLKQYPLFVPYQRPDWINTKEPEAAYFRDEWQSVPPYIAGSDDGSPNRHLSVCLGSEWQDFMLHYAVKAYDQNRMVGYYFDGGLPWSCKNTAHGHGWLDAQGNENATYPLLAYREFYKRLATEFHKRGRPYLVWVHTSNCLEMPTVSFADMVWDGEQFSVAASASRNYASLFTLSYFRSEFLGQQFGLPVQWLVEFFNQPGKEPLGPREIDSMLLFALLHGTADNVLASNIPTEELLGYVKRVLEAQDEFGVREKDCRFLPYWNNARYVLLDPKEEDTACSIWLRPGKALVILANAGPVGRQVTARLNLGELGLGANPEAANLMTREAIPVQNGTIALDMPPASWKAMVVHGNR